MRILIVDNYDSFTFNLYQGLAEIAGEEPIVLRNDVVRPGSPEVRDADAIVLSPGPGRPDSARDFGAGRDLIRACEVPLLGVCLGHQGIAHAFGGSVAAAPSIFHGRISQIRHSGDELYAGIAEEFSAVRYHSLAVSSPLPGVLEEVAWTRDGVLMGLRHRERPIWGVQFHPESVSTPDGLTLLRNFVEIAGRHRRRLRDRQQPHRRRPGDRQGQRQRPRTAGGRQGQGQRPRTAGDRQGQRQRPRTAGQPSDAYSLCVEKVEGIPDTGRAFGELFGEHEYAFWLDSSLIDGQQGRYSFMGTAQVPGGEVLTYDVGAGCVERLAPDTGARAREAGTIFTALTEGLERAAQRDVLPFDLGCGYVGYFGYEMKGECGAALVHRAATPDAAFLFAPLMLAFDHATATSYVLCLANPELPVAAAKATAAGLAERLGQLIAAGPLPPPAAAGGLTVGGPAVGGPEKAGGLTVGHGPAVGEGLLGNRGAGAGAPPDFRMALNRDEYVRAVELSQRQLVAGESYEICLTNRIEAEVGVDPLRTYLELRRTSPAPHAAYLRFGEHSILSSSPERFLRISRDGLVESMPIKGTRRRGSTKSEDARLLADLVSSDKDRAENLMIVDLLRNDLGLVCEVGSVEVPGFMEAKTYEHVHQLVSTVRGRLRRDRRPLDCVVSCFPGGSMTGAPKLRTMEIVDSLEPNARGVYSGALGYFGLSGGADLSIVIRTLTMNGAHATIGAGGAVTVLSDPEAEFDEMLTKARPLLNVLNTVSAGGDRRVPSAVGAV